MLLGFALDRLGLLAGALHQRIRLLLLIRRAAVRLLQKAGCLPLALGPRLIAGLLALAFDPFGLLLGSLEDLVVGSLGRLRGLGTHLGRFAHRSLQQERG